MSLKENSKSISYKDAGVDIEQGDRFVERIKQMVGVTYDDRVCAGVGGFASLYSMGEGRYLASGTDGVGTKLLLANQLNEHKTIGIDLVAMCVNDILCTGARPLFFLDYLASGKLEIETHCDVVSGIVEGCRQAGAALIGGETAEMPGMYEHGHYDLAGFAVGEVFEEQLLDGQQLKEGMSLIGLSSSGVHSNGLSLVRKLFAPEETDWLKMALTPTKIYVKDIQKLQKSYPQAISGLAHITGGGLTNLARLNRHFDIKVSHPPALDKVSPLFGEMKKRSKLDSAELYRTFNMGVGLVIFTDRPLEVKEFFKDSEHQVFDLGIIEKGEGETKLLCPDEGKWITL